MNHATMTKIRYSEQMLLSHLESCYSAALALTHSLDQALALTKDTLLWGWQSNDGSWDEDSMKRALLSELRARYLRDYKPVRNRAASFEKQLEEAGA